MADWLGLPVLASEHGDRIDLLIVLFHVLMAVIFIGWTAFFVYCLVRFRRAGAPAVQRLGFGRALALP